MNLVQVIQRFSLEIIDSVYLPSLYQTSTNESQDYDDDDQPANHFLSP